MVRLSKAEEIEYKANKNAREIFDELVELQFKESGKTEYSTLKKK